MNDISPMPPERPRPDDEEGESRYGFRFSPRDLTLTGWATLRKAREHPVVMLGGASLGFLEIALRAGPADQLVYNGMRFLCLVSAAAGILLEAIKYAKKL